MAFVASQLIEEVTAHAQSNSLEDGREICADGTYVLNNLRTACITACNCINNYHPSLTYSVRTWKMRIQGVLISPQPDQEGNRLQGPNSGFIQHTTHEVQYNS